MKKFLALIMALTMVFALVACGQTEANESDESIEEIIIVSSEESTANISSDTPSTTTPPPTPSQQTPAACTHKNVQVTDAVAATCKDEGKTEGKICKDCGAVIVASQPIAKLEQHYFAAATPEKPATCTVCGLERGTVAAPPAPKAFVSNPTMTMNGATITFSISKVQYVENNTKCNIIYTVNIANGSNPGKYSWKVDVGHGDVGKIIVSNISAETPNIEANATYDGTFETGPVDVIGNVGYKLTFK